MSDGAFEDKTKAVLRPRNAGEDLKIKETVLKRKDRNLKAKAQRAEKIAEERRKKAGKRIDKLVTPARLIKDSLVRKKDAKRLKRIDKMKKQKVKEENGKVLIAVRNHRKKPTKAVAQVLQKFRLTEIASLVFLPYNDATCKELKVVEPFVYWGYPSFKTVNDLLHKKAHFKTSAAEKQLLTSNALLEEHLGDVGVLCVEDLVSAIYHNEENFSKVTERLWPIQLGDFTKDKAEGFKVETKAHMSGDQGRNVNKIVKEVL